MPERCTGKDHIFEIVENPFKWGVFIGVYLIDDNALLFVNLLLRKNGVKDDVSNQFGCFGYIPFERSGVNDSLLFGGVGIQLASRFSNRQLMWYALRWVVPLKKECSSRWAKPYSDGSSSRLPVLTVRAQWATAERACFKIHRIPLGKLYWINSMRLREK